MVQAIMDPHDQSFVMVQTQGPSQDCLWPININCNELINGQDFLLR